MATWAAWRGALYVSEWLPLCLASVSRRWDSPFFSKHKNESGLQNVFGFAELEGDQCRESSGKELVVQS